MSRNWIITPDDLKGGELAQPGWHTVEIIKYEDGEAGESAKNPGSATCTFFFKIIEEGPDKGIECRRLFSETAWGFARDFFTTMKYPKDEKGNYKISSDLFQQSVGHKLQIYIKRGKSNKGNEFNDVADFRPLS
jgi:hypothetical protein